MQTETCVYNVYYELNYNKNGLNFQYVAFKYLYNNYLITPTP